jgi:hypothetical protein
MGTVCAGLESSLVKWMEERSSKYRFVFLPCKEAPTDSNRNHIARDFLKGGYDYLAMFDDDTFPHRNPFDLLEFNKDVIGGVYPGWGEKGLRFHIYKESDKKLKGIPGLGQIPVKERQGLQKVDAIGTGCIFIKRRVLEGMKTPFSYTYDDDGVLNMSDDIAFCHRCKDAGFEVWGHWDYLASHFKTVDLFHVIGMVAKAAKTGDVDLSL